MNDEQLSAFEIQAADEDSKHRKLLERTDRLHRFLHLLKKPHVRPFYFGYVCPECHKDVDPQTFPVNYSGTPMIVYYLLCECGWEYVLEKQVFF